MIGYNKERTEQKKKKCTVTSEGGTNNAKVVGW